MEASETKDEKPPRRLSGTREWADDTRNIQIGCEHDCRYCYARYNAVRRFKSCSREQWRAPRIDAARVDRDYGKVRGRIMFPSSHDITKRNVSECAVVLRKMLEAGNEVLVVTKPDLDCIGLLCESLRQWQRQVMFRFTIGSVAEATLRFWEPGAPSFESRIKSLMSCYLHGWRTSVSCEPYLDPYPQHVFSACYDYLSNDPAGGFWIGKLRHWASRVDMAGATKEELQRFVEPLQAAQSDAFVHGLVREICGRRYVRFKDSIREVIERQDTGDRSQETDGQSQ